MSAYAAGTAAATAPTVLPTADRLPGTPDRPQPADPGASPSWLSLLAAAAATHTHPDA